MSTDLKTLRDAYKNFFVNSEAGQYFMQKLTESHTNNLQKAQDEESLQHLSRAKGNSEAIDHIHHVLNTKLKEDTLE